VQLEASHQSEVEPIAGALKAIKLTPSQREDIQRLYEAEGGFPYTFDSMNRPQGPTLEACRRIGSKLKVVLGLPQYRYGMNVVGCRNGSGNW
jgi:hypothetical protein